MKKINLVLIAVLTAISLTGCSTSTTAKETDSQTTPTSQREKVTQAELDSFNNQVDSRIKSFRKIAKTVSPDKLKDYDFVDTNKITKTQYKILKEKEMSDKQREKLDKKYKEIQSEYKKLQTLVKNVEK